MTAPVKKRHHYHRWVTEISESFWLIKKRPWLLWTLGGSIALGVLLVGAFLLFLHYYTGHLKDDRGVPLDFGKIERGDFKRASYVYDYDGQEIIGRFFYEIRDPIKTEDVPKLLAKAFVDAEDKNFYAPFHRGIDPFAILRASVFNLARQWKIVYNRPRSGASGIHQQLARLTYAGEVESFRNREYSLKRKFIEARVAIQLARRYNKKTILTAFLNEIYFGHGANGIAEAWRYYFGKDLKNDELSLRKIAILVSLNKSPSIYCPIFHQPVKPDLVPDLAEKERRTLEAKYEAELAREQARVILARERYNWVLGRMRDENDISKDQFNKATFKKDEPLELSVIRVTPFKDSRFGYGNRVVKEMLFGQGYSDDEISFSRGLWIKTGFNSEIQKIMTEEVNKQLAEINKELPEGAAKIEGSFVAIENKTGRIVAFSGGHDFSETQYNRALALRSPGSAFKPFVFAAAFEFGKKTFDDQICNCPFSMRGAGGKRWAPKNFQEDNPVPFGYRPLPEILIRSVNLGTLNLARSIGLKPIIETAHRTGLWGERGVFKDPDGKIWFKRTGLVPEEEGGLDPLLPTAIGASDVSLLELVNAYAVFQRGGIYLKPQMILEVKDSTGKILYKAEEQKGQRVLSEETARRITILLRAVTKIGTAKISMRDIKQQMAVKTGTSKGPNDLVVGGYNPEFTFGIRFGYDQPKPIALPVYMKKVSGVGHMQVSGGWVVGPVLRRIIDRIYENRSRVEFSPEIETGLRELLGKLAGKI